MSAPALIFALALMAADSPPADTPPQGEPLPAGAPTEDYPLTAWCYGAMSEYLDVYDRVKPDLKAIDKMFGSSVPNEPEPYASDMAAAHVELKVLAEAVTAAEKASPNAIGPQGAQAVKLGRSIWSPAEAKTNRELARAWLSWALPDRCDTTARALTTKSALLGQALKYNTPAPDDGPPAAPAPESEPAAQPPEAAGHSDASPAPPQAGATSVDSILAGPTPSHAPSPSDSQTPPPTATETPPNGETSPETSPSTPPTLQDQADPNAAAPDGTPPKS